VNVYSVVKEQVKEAFKMSLNMNPFTCLELKTEMTTYFRKISWKISKSFYWGRKSQQKIACSGWDGI